MNPLRYVIADLTTEQARTLRGLFRIDSHRIGLAVAANSWHNTAYAAGEAVMDALGKPADTTGSSLSGAELLQAAEGWLIAEGVREAVIIDADATGTPNLHGTIEWLLRIGIDPVVHMATSRLAGQRDPLVAFIEAWPATPVELDTIVPASRVQLPHAPDPTPPSFPAVPRVDGVVFRSTARRQLEPADFAVVDAFLSATVQQMRSEIAAMDPISAESLASMWRDHLERCSTVDEVVVITRAFQIVTTLGRWLVSVDTPALVAGALHHPRAAHRDGDWWARLDTYRDPAIPAMAAFISESLFLDDVSPLDLCHVTLTATAPWEVTVHAGSEAIHFGGPAAKMIAAHVHARRAAGARPDDPLFLTQKGSRLVARTMHRLAYAPTAEVGIAYNRKLSKTTPVNLARRHGISITNLERERRAAR